VEFEPSSQEPRLLAVSARHRLAGARTIELEELDREGVVSSLHWSQQLRDYWAGVGDGVDASYRVAALANSPGEWLTAIAEGIGVSLCPASIANYYTRDDLAYVRVGGLAPSSVGLAWRNDQVGPLMRNFIDSTRAYLEQNPALRWQSRNGAQSCG
jgi:DNA-binding transcriptional LysR family regulator